MSTIDFQNGFACGMAMKNLIRSGELYRPIIWNDEGVYTNFYIDFRREVQPFSTGMWNESVVVHDSVQIKATDVIDQTGGVYKIVCDISNRPHGITVMNKKTSRLRFASGEAIPAFSVHMFIAGIVPYIDGGYSFEKTQVLGLSYTGADTTEIAFWENIDPVSFTESTTIQALPSTSTTERHNIILT